VDWDEAAALIDEHGDPVFCVDLSAIRAAASDFTRAFRAEFADVEVAYAYKANRLRSLCAAVRDTGLMAEVASLEELALARELGVDPARTVVTVRAWPAEAIEEVMRAGCVVNLDSLRDVRVASEVARADSEFAVGLRCGMPVDNPAARSHGLGMANGEFDEAVAVLHRAPGIRLAGLHCHVPEHGVRQLADRAAWLADLARRLPAPPDYLDLGGGFTGAPEAYARAIASALAPHYPDPSARPRLIVEPGAAIVTGAVWLLTRVVGVERGDGVTVAVVAASVLQTSPIMRRADFPATLLRAGDDGDPKRPPPRQGPLHVASSSPLIGDFVAVDLPGPVAEGDILVLREVGAYSMSAGSAFVPPAAVVVTEGPGSPWQRD